MMFYQNHNDRLELPNGLALSPDGTKLAVYVFNQDSYNFEIGSKEGIFFIVSTYDGIQPSRDIYIKHNPNNDHRFTLYSDSMYWDPHGKVYMAFQLSGSEKEKT